MTILTLLWRFTIGGAWKWLAAGAGILALYGKGRADAKAKRGMKDLKATVKGAENAREGRAEATEKLRQGQTPEQIVRSNDDAWS